MKVLGITNHSLKSVTTFLEKGNQDYSVYPKVTGKFVLSVTVEELLLALKAAPSKMHLVLDVPTHLNGMHIKMIGAQLVEGGTYVRTALRMPKALPDYNVDKSLLATRLAISNVRRHLKKK